MAKFLNTSAANYYLEEIIRLAHNRLILLSPFLKLNDRVKELLEDRNRLKVDVRLIYGKNELQPEEILAAASIDPMARPETLSPEDFANFDASACCSM